MCSHTESVWSRADRDFFSTKKKKYYTKTKNFFDTVEIPTGSISLFGEYSTKVFWLLSKLKKNAVFKVFQHPQQSVCLL